MTLFGRPDLEVFDDFSLSIFLHVYCIYEEKKFSRQALRCMLLKLLHTAIGWSLFVLIFLCFLLCKSIIFIHLHFLLFCGCEIIDKVMSSSTRLCGFCFLLSVTLKLWKWWKTWLVFWKILKQNNSFLSQVFSPLLWRINFLQ